MPLTFSSCNMVKLIRVERVLASDSFWQRLRLSDTSAGTLSRLGRRVLGDSAMLRWVS